MSVEHDTSVGSVRWRPGSWSLLEGASWPACERDSRWRQVV